MDETLLWLYDDSGIENGAANAKGSQANREKILCVKTKRRGDPCFRRAKRKKWKARIRLLEALLESEFLPADLALERLHVTSVVAKPLGSKRNFSPL